MNHWSLVYSIEAYMSILTVMLWLVLIGAGLWLINTFLAPYMHKWILTILNVFVTIAVVLWLLSLLGILSALNMPLPRF